jgi:glyoxylase-like metal-dependent hydrolase (beta-lactamase superfamily II)
MKVTEHCYAVLGLGCIPPWTVNAGFIVGSSTTLVVDAGANRLAAQTIHGYATAAQPRNPLLVINTEMHLDHIGGNAFFADLGIDVYGHAGIRRSEADLAAEHEAYNACIPDRVRRDLREERVFFEETRIVNPNKPIRNVTSLDLGGLAVEILMTPGHTATNLSVFVPSDGVLYSGDCVVNGYLPNLEAGSTEDWRMWVRSLDLIESLKPKHIIPGHGQHLEGPQMQTEIHRIRAILQEAVAKGRAPTAD